MAQKRPDRPVFSKEIGAYFLALREGLGWKQQQAADIAARKKIALSYNQLRYLEEGKTKDVEPDVLRAVAKLYRRSYEEVAGRYIDLRYGADVRSEAARDSDQASARLAELRDRLERVEHERTVSQAVLDQVRAVLAASDGDRVARALSPAGLEVAQRFQRLDEHGKQAVLTLLPSLERQTGSRPDISESSLHGFETTDANLSDKRRGGGG